MSKGKENVKKYLMYLSIDYMLILYLGYTELIMLKLISPGLKLFTGATRNFKLHMRPAFNFLIDSTRREFQSSTFHRNSLYIYIYIFFFTFWLCCEACGILVPPPGI